MFSKLPSRIKTPSAGPTNTIVSDYADFSLAGEDFQNPEPMYSRNYQNTLPNSIKFQFLTFATHSEGGFELLKKSIRKSDGFVWDNFKQLGEGEKWNNFIDKYKLLHKEFYERKQDDVSGEEFLVRKNQSMDNDILVIADAFDVVYVGQSIFNLIAAFEKTHADIVISADGPTMFAQNNLIDENAWLISIKSFLSKRIFSTLKAYEPKKICACPGLIIGRRWAIRTLVDYLIENENEFGGDDQFAVNMFIDKEFAFSQERNEFKSAEESSFFGKKPNEKMVVKVDTNCELFFNIFGGLFFGLRKVSPDIVVKIRNHQLKKNLSMPYFLHFPGEQELTDVISFFGKVNGVEISEPENIVRSRSMSLRKMAHYAKFIVVKDFKDVVYFFFLFFSLIFGSMYFYSFFYEKKREEEGEPRDFSVSASKYSASRNKKSREIL